MGIIEDNFSGMSEGFSSGAWRDFTAELGPNKILEEDLFLTTDSGLYLFNYVCGAGFYTSCNGLGTTDSFKMNNPAVFNHMFGSFFGDFDIANNIGRASLAAPDNGLIWIWSGRPKWLTHTLAIGETIGQCALRTQNNDWNYGVSFYQNQAHVALNGDPSIRSAMFEPATSLGIGTNSEKTRVNLSWTASTAQDVTGYYIYWSNNEFGPYLLLNQTPESGSSFTHYTPEFGSNYYMIRAERLEITGSATYYNLSQGQFISIDSIERTTSIPPTIGIPFTVYPVPTDDHLMVRFSDAQPREIRVLNLQGQVVLETKVLDSTVRLNVSEYPRGLYFVEVNGQRRKFIKS
jgi:hypothetical protein